MVTIYPLTLALKIRDTKEDFGCEVISNDRFGPICIAAKKSLAIKEFRKL